MNSPEARQYLIGGEVPSADWSLALGLLEKLGITATVFEATTPDGTDLQTPPETLLKPGTIPYALHEIRSRDQYLGNEHLGAFWPEYRKQEQDNGRAPNKHEALCWGLNMLAHPRQKIALHRATPGQTADLVQALGLVIVEPRSLVGFSDTYLPLTYGLWNHKDYGKAVIEVGSFISAARLLRELPVEERPYAVDIGAIRFFNALADKLEAQIAAATQTE